MVKRKLLHRNRTIDHQEPLKKTKWNQMPRKD